MKLLSFKKQKNFKKGGFHTNPDICWEIILYLAFAIIIGVLVFGVYLFNRVDQEFTVPDFNTGAPSGSISKNSIDKVLQYFSVREAKSTQILNSPAPFVDPSL